jgi:hypothetical protein
VVILLVPLSTSTPCAFYDLESALRLQVTPRETEVFVDGYFAGRVDDFDGRFQRLRIQPGEHELTLYLAGHRKVTQPVLVQPRATFRIRYTMSPLAPGEVPDVRPAAPPARREGQPIGAAPVTTGESAEYGTLAIRVQPADAEVLIDGERWDGATAIEPLIVQLTAESHRVEVRKAGYRTYTTQIEIRRGEKSPVNVSLSREEGR